MKKTTKIFIAIVLLLGFIAGGATLILHRQNIHGRRSIQSSYHQIQMPSSMRFLEQYWDDRQSSDPAINSSWNYTYAIDDKDHAKVKDDIIRTLGEQGFSVRTTYEAHDPDQYSFDLEGRGLNLSFLVGCHQDTPTKAPTAGDNVLVVTEYAY